MSQVQISNTYEKARYCCPLVIPKLRKQIWEDLWNLMVYWSSHVDELQVQSQKSKVESERGRQLTLASTNTHKHEHTQTHINMNITIPYFTPLQPTSPDTKHSLAFLPRKVSWYPGATTDLSGAPASCSFSIPAPAQGFLPLVFLLLPPFSLSTPSGLKNEFCNLINC